MNKGGKEGGEDRQGYRAARMTTGLKCGIGRVASCAQYLGTLKRWLLQDKFLVLSTRGRGITDGLVAADTARIYAPCMKASKQARRFSADWITWQMSTQNPFCRSIPKSFCTLPIDHPLKKAKLLSSREYH